MDITEMVEIEATERKNVINIEKETTRIINAEEWKLSNKQLILIINKCIWK